MQGKEKPKGSITLDDQWSEHGSGNTQENSRIILEPEGTDTFVLRKTLTKQKFPSGFESPISEERWTIPIEALIRLVMERGTKTR